MQKGPLDRAFDTVFSFCLAVVKSCFDLEWYRAVRSRPRPLAPALRYAVAFHAAVAMYATAVLASYLFGAETAFIVHVNRTFPEDARISVESGHLSTNLPEPFEAGGKWFRVVIDTSVEGHEVPPKYDDIPGFLIGRDAIFMPKPHVTHPTFATQQRHMRMEKFSGFTVTKVELLEWFRVWGALSILGALFVFAIMYLLYLIARTAAYVAVVSVVAVPLGRRLGTKLSYKAWFAVGLYAVTLPTLVNLGLSAIGPRFPLAFTYTLIYLAFIAAVIADGRGRPKAAG